MARVSDSVFVWTWLPGAVEPIPAGVVQWRGPLAEFSYRRTYLARGDAIALGPELPLLPGWQQPAEGLTLAGCLRDGLPDHWGQTVLRHERPDMYTTGNDDYSDMLLSGTDRFGAIDFQTSDDTYVPRKTAASLDELHQAAALLEAGEPLTPTLEAALLHGTSIGGARPKALIRDDQGGSFIAKFSSTSDRGLPVVNAEAACLDLARLAGIDAAEGRVVESLGNHVLLVSRFDRNHPGGRRHTVSALTTLGLDSMFGRYATYPDYWDRLVEAGADPTDGIELFGRIVFNVATSNSDDHARNHAAFWDGNTLTMTPAYDLAPGHRTGDSATQAMAIGRDGERESNFRTCLEAAHVYGLDNQQAREVIDRVTETINEHWQDAADRAHLTRHQADTLWGRQILNPAVHYGRPKTMSTLNPARPAGTATRRGKTTRSSNAGSFAPTPRDERAGS